MVKWIVDKYIFESNKIPEKVFEELEIEFFEFDYIPFLTDKIVIPYSNTEPVIVYSTLNAVRHLKSFFGCYFNELLYNCNVYMSLLETNSRNFLNHDHIYCTFSDLDKDYNYYFDLFDSNQLFFRPNNGIKEFTGDVFSRNNMRSELDAIKYMYNIDPASMIMISTPKTIYDETRFIIGNKEIIDMSRYRIGSRQEEDCNVDQSCIDFVKRILGETTWVPDDIFVMDIALTDNGPKIVELNAFSCSGWYDGMNPKHIIKKVSEITLDKIKKENNND